MGYRIDFTRRADRQYRKLPTTVQQRMAPHIDALAENPRPVGALPLAGEQDVFRIRVGDYRIIYSIKDMELLVLVVKVGHRREVYR